MADFLIPMEAGFWLAFATAAMTVALIVRCSSGWNGVESRLLRSRIFRLICE
jgi:hypothetical protein